MERSDQVLALRQVDRGLAADRRIDLRDERRRDVDERDTAQVRRGEEPGGIAERAAADRDDRLVPFDAASGELAGRGLDHGQPLRGLALRQQHRLESPGASNASARSRPKAVQAPGSETRIARRASSRPRTSFDGVAAIAVADHDPSDRCRRPDHRRAGSPPIRRAGQCDSTDARTPVTSATPHDVDIGSRVEALTPDARGHGSHRSGPAR